MALRWADGYQYGLADDGAEYSMTLLGVLLTPTRFYAFADGRSERPGPRFGDTFEHDKFTHTQGEPVAWGVIGNPDVAISFGKSLENPHQSTWPVFASGIRAKWFAIRYTQLVELRVCLGLPPNSHLSAEVPTPANTVVVTGFVGVEPGITVAGAGPDERSTETEPGLYAFGPWRSCVYAAWAAVRRHKTNAKITKPKAMRDLLEPVVDSLKGLYLPVNIWEITPDGEFTKLP